MDWKLRGWQIVSAIVWFCHLAYQGQNRDGGIRISISIAAIRYHLWRFP